MNSAPSSIPSAASMLAKLEQMPRRIERRFAHRVPCRVRTNEPTNERAINTIGQTVNLSASGVAVQLAHPIETGTPVEVYLPHLDGAPTLLHGHVAHSRRVLMGTFEIGIRILSQEAQEQDGK